jgi:hypothetical protein
MGTEKEVSLLSIIVLRVLFFTIGHRKRKYHWAEVIQQN